MHSSRQDAWEDPMKIGEVGLLTNNVIKLADFYKQLLKIDNGSEDEVHQTISVKLLNLQLNGPGAQPI